MFYHDRGEFPTTFAWADCRPGHTMVLLYAEMHAFMDMSCGVRQEELDYVYVFKASQDQAGAG